MVLNIIYMSKAPRFISPSWTSPMNSRLVYPSIYSTCPHGSLTDLPNMSKTKFSTKTKCSKAAPVSLQHSSKWPLLPLVAPVKSWSHSWLLFSHTRRSICLQIWHHFIHNMCRIYHFVLCRYYPGPSHHLHFTWIITKPLNFLPYLHSCLLTLFSPQWTLSFSNIIQIMSLLCTRAPLEGFLSHPN